MLGVTTVVNININTSQIRLLWTQNGTLCPSDRYAMNCSPERHHLRPRHNLLSLPAAVEAGQSLPIPRAGAQGYPRRVSGRAG